MGSAKSGKLQSAKLAPLKLYVFGPKSKRKAKPKRRNMGLIGRAVQRDTEEANTADVQCWRYDWGDPNGVNSME